MGLNFYLMLTIMGSGIMKKYRIIGRNDDCVLLETIGAPKQYKVRDIENDDIVITADKEQATETFNNYDIDDIRAERRKMFDKWIEEFCDYV